LLKLKTNTTFEQNAQTECACAHVGQTIKKYLITEQQKRRKNYSKANRELQLYLNNLRADLLFF
jgi:hypothetical protein